MASFTQPFTLTATTVVSGPTATSTFATVDFTNMVSPGGVSNVTVWPQLFGVATGGMFNGSNWINNPTFRGLVRALNLPLFRLNGLYINGAGDLSSVVNNITAVVPSTCTMVIGINTGADFQGISAFWKNNSPIPCNNWEVGNEFSGQPAALGSYGPIFSSAAAAIHRTDPTFKVSGPVWAGFDGRPASQGGAIATLIQQNTASSLGFLNYHQYSYCDGAGPTPSDDQACLAITLYDQNSQQSVGLTPNTNQFPQLTTQLQAYTVGTYASNYPVLLGEYNIECSASFNDTRAHTSIGCAFLCSCLLGFASTSTQPCWGALWDLMDDDGAGYDLIDSGLNTHPQYYCLQQLIAHMPGTMVASSTGSTGGGLQAWGTKNGTSFGVAIVNSNGGSASGQVALSHWPVNTTGNATIHVWTYPTGGGANTPGDTTTATVTAGLVNVFIPGHSCAILFP